MNWLNGVAELWFNWMWPMFWQVNLLIVIVWLVDTLIRRRVWPQVRYALWLLVLLKLVIPPTWSLPVSVTEPLVRPVVERFEAGAEFLATTSGGGATDTEVSSPIPAAPNEAMTTRAAGATRPVWQVWPFLIWIVGMAIFCGILWRQLRSLRRRHDAQHPRQTIPEWYHELLVEITRDWKLARLPAIVFSDDVATPAVCGVWQPVLFLPSQYLKTLTREEARHVLLHELAHVKRGDLWLHAAAMTLQIIYWFNPLLALARRQIQHVREICCDLTVAGELREETGGYRDTLLGTARELLSQSMAPGLGLLGVFEEPFRLVPRLRWLEQQSWVWQRRAIAAATVVALVAIPLLLPMGGVGTAAGLIGSDRIADNSLDLQVAMVSRDKSSSGLSGDVALYQRNVFSRHRLCLGFRFESERLAESEMWIGDGWVAEKAYGRTLVVDFNESIVIYIDHEQGLWAETPLPLYLDELYDDDLRRRMRRNRSYGEVLETGRTRKIEDVKCREYRVDQWRIRNGMKHDFSTLRVWASEEPPYFSKVFADFLDVLRQLHDRDSEYRRELKKIRGLQLRLEFKEGTIWQRIRLVDCIEEIAVVQVPAGLLVPPADYRRVERLTELR